MSTKTTFKRIALVAVSALGFGVLSTIPANAAGYTSAISLSTSSLTVVNGDVETDAEAGFFYVDTTNLNGTTSSAAGLQDGETMTVSVITAPTGQAIGDLFVQPVTIEDTVASDFDPVADGVTYSSTYTLPDTGDTLGEYVSNNNSWSATPASNNEANRYWFAVYPSADTKATGYGEYSIQVRVLNGNSAALTSTLKVKFVATIADAGATLTLAKLGNVTKGDAYAFTATTSMTATLKDANAGRVVLGTDHEGGTRTAWAPELNAAFLNAAGTVGADTLAIADSGVTAVDHLCTTTTCADDASDDTGLTQTLSQALLAAGNGVYGVTAAAAVDAAVSSAATLRVRVTNTGVSATLAITIVANTAATSAATAVTASATGLLPAHTVARTVVSKALTYTVPASTSAVSLSVDTDGAAGDIFSVKTTWSGTYATASITPADATTTNYTAGDAGKFTVSLSNASDMNGGTATVEISGFATIADKVTITVNWESSVPSTVTFTAPTASVFVKTKSATVFSALVTDQFGNAVSGAKVQPSLSGANNPDDDTYAPLTTDANGSVSYTVTDTLALADETDAVTFTAIGYASATASRSVTYKATLPAVSTMSFFYNQDFSDSTAADITAAVPSAGIMDGTSGVTMVIARNQSKDLSANTEEATNDMVAIRIRNLTSAGAAAAGAAITLTAGTGGHVLNGSGLPASSRTVAVDSDGDTFFRIMATAPGTITFTATSGTASSSFKLVVKNPTNEAGRTVAVSGAATGTANGDGVPVTATIKDRYGNGVSGVTLIVTASGVGSIAGGATSQSFTTDSSGTYTFLATSTVAAGGSATYSVRASNATDADSAAGYTGATPVDSTLAAGISSANHSVTFAAGTNASQAAAEAASDAAAEAIDAANAATDAANLAAEAADAATVAAEEARDAADAATAAVEELATQVATLMAALKAQITTLANTVAKIAKKVKA